MPFKLWTMMKEEAARQEKGRGLADLIKSRQETREPQDKTVPANNPITPGGRGFGMVPILVVGAVILAGYFLYTIVAESEPIRVSEDFIRRNSEIQTAVGQVKDVTPTYPFSFDIGGREARANIAFNVEGSGGSVKVFLVLAKSQGPWRVASAQYQDSGGVIRPLSTDKRAPEGRGAGAGTDSPAAGYRESLARGHAFFKTNDFPKAAAEYSRAIQDDPSVYQGYYWRGIANARMNKDGNAAADFLKVVEIVPGHAGAFNWLGWLHYKNGRYDDAIADFSQSIRLRGDYGWSYYQRGRCYMQKGSRSQARVDFEKACLYQYKPACPEAEKLKTDA